MLTRKLLLTTVICGGLVTVSGLWEGARAATLLQPNSDWAVSSLAATQSGGHPYCALARRFSNNVIFTVARNSQDESSVAIDFQKPTLNNTQTYSVSLKPGFSQDRVFNVRPVSGKAIVIRLGQDYAFHDALNRSGKLDVEFSGTSYSFNLSDFSDGQKRLGECLVNLVEPAAGTEAAAMTPVPPQEPVKARAIPVSDVSAPPPAAEPVMDVKPPSYVPESNGEAEALREENNRLRNALERERRNYEDRYMQESQSSSMAAELNEKVRLLEMENGELRRQITHVPVAAAEPQSCPAPDNSALTSLEGEVVKLRAENASLRSEGGKNATLATELSVLRAENESLKAGGDKTAALHNELAALRAENATLKTDGGKSAAMETELNVLREENLRLKQQGSSSSAAIEANLEQLRNDNLRLKQDVAAQQAKNELLEKQIAEKSVPASADASVVDGLRGRVARLETENKELKAANASLQKGGGDVPVSLAQLRSVEEQLRYVEADRDKLLKQIESVNQGKRDGLLDISTDNWNLEQATRRFNEAELEIQRLARQLEENRTKCAVEKKELEYMLFDPGVAEQEQISKLIKLEKTVNEAQAVLDDKVAGYEEKIAALEEKAKSADGAVEIKVAEYKQKMAVLEQELASRGTVGADARNRITTLETSIAQLEQKARAAETALQTQKVEYQQKTALLEKQLASAQQQLASNGAVSGAVKDQIASLQGEMAKLAQEKSSSEATLASQHAEYQQTIAKLEMEKSSLQKTVSGQQQTIAGIQQELASRDAFSDESRERIASLEQEVEQARLATLQTANAEMDKLRQERDGIAAQNAKLNDTIAALETQLADIQTAAGEPVQDPVADARIAKLMSDNDTLLQERNRLEEERNALAQQQASLNAQVASLENALADIPTGSGGPAVSAPIPVSAQPIAAAAKGNFDQAYSPSKQYEDVAASVQKTVEPAVAASGTTAASALQSVLSRAQVPLQGQIEKTGAEGNAVAFSWDTGTLYGSAEQQPMGNIAKFDELAGQYLEKTRSRCQGEFAAVPTADKQEGSIRVSAYEIACIAGSEGASASIVFYSDNGKFTAIAHETGLDGMDEAMDVRDRLIDTLMSTKTAAR